MNTPSASPARLLSLFLGQVQEVPEEGSGEWWDKPWRSSFFRERQTAPCWLGYEGFRADEQADRRVHGGVDRAVCVYPDEHYPFWHETLTGVPLPQGAFGENFTTQGLLETEVCIGDHYQLGGAVVQVSQPREPCWKLARRWRVKHLTALVEQTGRTGFYFRVLQHGLVGPGDRFTLLKRPFPEWTPARCNPLRHHDKEDHTAALALAVCPLLSAVWKDALWARSRQEA